MGISRSPVAVLDGHAVVRRDRVQIPPRQVREESAREANGTELAGGQRVERYRGDTGELRRQEPPVEGRVVGDDELDLAQALLQGQFVESLAAQVPAFQTIARAIAQLDLSACFARIVLRRGYVRPVFGDTPAIEIEAGEAFGATKRQLLWKVELPAAMPSIMAGLTQCIMLSLSMPTI